MVVGLETHFCALLEVWGGWDLGCWLLTRKRRLFRQVIINPYHTYHDSIDAKYRTTWSRGEKKCTLELQSIVENVRVHVVFWISFKISFWISGSVFVPERHVLVQTPTFSVFTKTHTLSRLSKMFNNLLYVCHGFYYHWVEKHQPNLTTPGIGMMDSFQDEHTQ